jgi:ABC-type sulfate transport system permease subunit
MRILNNKQILLQNFSKGYGFYFARITRPDKMINAINCKKSIRLIILKCNWVFFHYAVGIITFVPDIIQRKIPTGCSGKLLFYLSET